MQVMTIKLLALAALVAGGWLAACSSSSASKSAADGGQDSGTDCGYPVVHNEAGCPATYATGSLPPTCAPVGLDCAYPGAGDGPCGTAILFCVAGPDGGAPHWGGAQ